MDGSAAPKDDRKLRDLGWSADDVRVHWHRRLGCALDAASGGSSVKSSSYASGYSIVIYRGFIWDLYGIYMGFIWDIMGITLWKFNIAIEHGPVEIVSFPISMVIFQFVM